MFLADEEILSRELLEQKQAVTFKHNSQKSLTSSNRTKPDRKPNQTYIVQIKTMNLPEAIHSGKLRFGLNATLQAETTSS